MKASRSLVPDTTLCPGKKETEAHRAQEGGASTSLQGRATILAAPFHAPHTRQHVAGRQQRPPCQGGLSTPVAAGSTSRGHLDTKGLQVPRPGHRPRPPPSPHSGLFLFFFFLSFLGPLQRHMEVPRLGSNQSCSRRPTPGPQQRRILNQLSEARDQTRNFTVPGRIR